MGKSNWQSANATSIYCGTQFHSRNCNTSDFAMAATNLWFPGIITTNFIIHCIDVAVSSAPFEPTKKLEYINRIVCMCLESTIYLSFVDWRSVAGCRLRVGWICQKTQFAETISYQCQQKSTQRQWKSGRLSQKQKKFNLILLHQKVDRIALEPHTIWHEPNVDIDVFVFMWMPNRKKETNSVECTWVLGNHYMHMICTFFHPHLQHTHPGITWSENRRIRFYCFRFVF